ncbi:MAG: hypothetical protein Q4D51_05240 [Eubacteriales bacterium]|nr:hypothetical protein [Eubacteriales bacterium]
MKKITLILLFMCVLLLSSPKAYAASKKVSYGDTIEVSLKKRAEGAISQGYPEMAKWRSDGKKKFVVSVDTIEFQYADYEMTKEEVMKNIEKCLGKKVGESFTLCFEGGDGTYYYKYTIKKIIRPKTTKASVNKTIKSFLTSQEMLSQESFARNLSDIQFAIVDLNHDGRNELITTTDDLYHANVYAYLGGKMTNIDWVFSGSYDCYKNKNLVFKSMAHTGDFYESYSKFVDGRMKVFAYAEGFDDFSTGSYRIKYKYYVGGKKTTAKKYKAYVKKLKKGGKKGKIKLHRNTAANRKKYIK